MKIILYILIFFIVRKFIVQKLARKILKERKKEKID